MRQRKNYKIPTNKKYKVRLKKYYSINAYATKKNYQPYKSATKKITKHHKFFSPDFPRFSSIFIDFYVALPKCRIPESLIVVVILVVVVVEVVILVVVVVLVIEVVKL